jgi:hypothetical protein
MTALVWHAAGTNLYETGVKNAVLFKRSATGTYPTGVAWNGITQVSESPEGADTTALYADDVKYLNLVAAEEFKATIEAFTYPDEFAECDGSAELAAGVLVGQQTRKPFGLVYKTTLGNDTLGNEYGYKLHIIYNAMAGPSEKTFATINESPEAITFSWEVSTTPEPVSTVGLKPTSSIVIDSTKADATKLRTLEDELFGTELIDANLPLPDEIAAIFA